MGRVPEGHMPRPIREREQRNMKYRQIHIDGHNPSSYPYLVIARDDDGHYRKLLNAHGTSPTGAIDWAKKNSDSMGEYARFLVIERGDQTQRTEWVDEPDLSITGAQHQYLAKVTASLTREEASQVIDKVLSLKGQR